LRASPSAGAGSDGYGDELIFDFLILTFEIVVVRQHVVPESFKDSKPFVVVGALDRGLQRAAVEQLLPLRSRS
jgi:hypothetical protein